MKYAVGLLLLTASSLFAADGPAWKPPAGILGEARERLNKGNYDEAKSKYESAIKDEKTAIAARIGLSRTLRRTGELDNAIQLLKAETKDVDLLAERSDLRFELGQWDEAMADAQAAIRLKDDHFLARWTIARVLRDKGELEEADRAMRWFVRTYTARSNADKDVVDPDELLLVAMAGAENARWHRLTKQFSFILNEVIKDALKSDPNLAMAEAFAGILLLEKYNRPDAEDAFDKALQINPKCVEAMVGKGLKAMQKFEIKDADQAADDALKVNPKFLPALVLKADVHFSAGDYAGAKKRLDEAKAINPRDASILGRLAAISLITKDNAEFEKLSIEAKGYDKKPSQFYFELASVLEERKYYKEAEQYYLTSTEMRPLMPHAPLAMGMLQMRLGKEKDARSILDKAFEADPFNVRARNTIEVLKHLDKYQTITTEHYILRYDQATDALLASFVAEYLEETHVELKRQFQTEPQGKTIVQLFNSHEMFSGRVVGLPDLHTIGACTGPLFAMASPRAKGVKRPFNWGRVVRHEMTHVFNLVETDYKCPHWLTEGLAVRNEQMSRPPSWTQVLRDRFKEKNLLNLDTIMFGFVRPKDQMEWSLAYCQSQIYVDYLVKNHGEGAIAKLLASYKLGDDTPTAIKKACGIDVKQFEEGYTKYVAEIVKPYLSDSDKKEPEKPLTFEQLKKIYDADPDDHDNAARYAEQVLKRNKPGDARKIVDDILKDKPGHGTATLVKAKLLMRAGDDETARELIDEAVKKNSKDTRLLYAAGLLYLEAKQTEKAAELLEQGRKLAPLDADWNGTLVRLYTETEQSDKLLNVLREVVAGDPDELVGRLKLAREAVKGKKYEIAEKYARESIQIDILNPEAQALYVEVLKAMGNEEKAEAMKKRFEKK